MKTIPNILTTCNCLHIALLVYLRFVAITKPLQYERIHRKHHIRSTIIIWCLSFIINISNPIALCYGSKEVHIFVTLFILHGFHTFPIISIIISYVRMIHVIHKRNKEQLRMSEFTDEKDRARTSSKLSTKMIKGVSICLIICYVPYLFWFQYVRIQHWNQTGCDKSKPSMLEVNKQLNTKENIFNFIERKE